MSATVVLTQMIMIFILILSGYIMTKLKKVDMEGSKQISAIVSNICNPALLLAGALSQDSQVTRADVLLVGAVTVGLFLLWILTGKVIGPLLRVPLEERKYYTLMCVFGNIAFIGIPLVTALVGPSCVIYVAVYNLVFHLVVYSYGISQLSPGGKFNWKKCINPGTIAGVIAIFIFWFDIPVPKIASDTVQYMGNATTFLALFIVGISLAQSSLKEIFCEVRLYPFVVIRQILLPIAAALLMGLFMKEPDMKATMVIMCAVPAANLPLMLARERNQEAAVLSKGIILTTLLSIITIPIITLFV